MAYTQNPGRGNNPKTGYGLPSPFKQEIELTKEYDKGKHKLAENRVAGATPEGIKVEKITGEASPNLPMHKVVKAGSYVRELNSKGGVVKEERMNSRGNESFYKNVANRNADVTKRQTANASLYNATSGGTSPDKLSGSQKDILVSLGKAKLNKK
jgi:hypothetical protein